jgi:DNA replication and repair protein RecF
MLVGKVNEIRYEHNHSSSLVQINSIPLKKAADLYGEFKYVVFTPDNLSLIKGEPALRRGYLDNVAIMQNKAHRRFSSEYNSALKQRCAAYFHGGSCPEMLSVWDDILIRQGINLTYGRLKYLDLIREYSSRIYEELSGGEQLSLVYNSDVFTDSISFDNREELYKVYKSRLDSVNSEGQSSKTPGAHKDDVVFCICGKNARSYGSQGQLRSIAVSLKLAEAQIIRDFNRENSVVLLDEVLGELDESRRRYVVEHFDTSQVFITSCNMNDFAGLANLKVWSVEDGVCTPRE